ncbi:EndoU domain-containing protein [Muricauda sp. 334s03]|uniref:EndoU domain-containing protein n=1 Tax=Flagellimonas yonaguniensis TaxID=3031325 RepID=A0ABT5XZ63_9FLAO|nr:EndoU domain-containing protein [[Muricauda] yonaguniensis]MDF0716483.1 EndoU domain-containing protein [[Muricauda] yonaguniensis]
MSQQQSTVFLNKIKSLNLDDDALKRFNLDLNDGAFAQAVAENPDLVEAWKKLDDLGDNAFDQLRKTPDFLEKFDGVVKNDGLNKHLLEGDVKIIGTNAAGKNIYKVTGIHSNKAFADGTTRIKPGTQLDDLGDEFYRAKVEKQIDGFVNAEGTNWKVKADKSTFFPDNWSAEKIQAEIANAFKNKTPLGGNKYQGTTTTDHTVVMFLDEAGKITTAFPSF